MIFGGTRRCALVVAVLTATAGAGGFASAPREPVIIQPWYALSQSGGGLGVIVDHVALFQRVTTGADGASFWVVESHRTDDVWRKRTETHQWIDGRSCPALEEALVDVPRMPHVRVTLPENFLPQIPPFHTPRTAIAVPALGASMGLAEKDTLADYDGEVTRWWSRAERDLKSCWRTEPIVIQTGRIRAELGSPEGIARWRP